MPASDVVIPLSSALLGALVGGAASTLGGLFARRHERLMQARGDLYRALPPVIDTFVAVQRKVDGHIDPGASAEALKDHAEALRRAAALTGEESRVWDILHRCELVQENCRKLLRTTGDQQKEIEALVRGWCAEGIQLGDELEESLAEKLR